MLVCLGTYVLASRSDGCTMLLHDVSHEEEEHACHMRRRISERPLLPDCPARCWSPWAVQISMQHIKLLTASCGCAVGFQWMRSHKSDCAARARACVRQVFKGAHGTQEATSLCLRSLPKYSRTRRHLFIFCFATTGILRRSACTTLSARFLAKCVLLAHVKGTSSSFQPPPPPNTP